MIDEKKTFEIFGYYTNNINRNEKVICCCDFCKEDRIISKNAALKSKMCSKCQRMMVCKINAKTNRFGRNHSEETKMKIGLSNSISQLKGEQSPLYGIKKSKKFVEMIIENNKNRVWSEESRKKLSESHKGKKLSNEHREKLSLKNKSRSGIKNPMYGKKAKHGKGEYYVKEDGTMIWMRSYWEIQTAKYLDSKKYKWTYESESFPINYVFENNKKDGTYCPDFYIQDLNEYWEIKGWWRGDAEEKYKSFMEQYKEIKINLYMKDDLENLGIHLRRIES